MRLYTRSRATAAVVTVGSNAGVDLLQDLQLALNIRGWVLLSTLLHPPSIVKRGCSTRQEDRVNRKSE